MQFSFKCCLKYYNHNFDFSKAIPFKFSNPLVFSWFLDLLGNLGNVKEKPIRKTCLSREKKRLAPRIYLAKLC